MAFTTSTEHPAKNPDDRGEQQPRSSKERVVGSSPLSYFSDSVAELKKVTFPTRAATRQATIVTVFIVLFVSLCLFLLDQVFFQLMKKVLE